MCSRGRRHICVRSRGRRRLSSEDNDDGDVELYNVQSDHKRSLEYKDDPLDVPVADDEVMTEIPAVTVDQNGKRHSKNYQRMSDSDPDESINH